MVKYNKAKSLDGSPRKSLKLRYTQLTWEPRYEYPAKIKMRDKLLGNWKQEIFHGREKEELLRLHY